MDIVRNGELDELAAHLRPQTGPDHHGPRWGIHNWRFPIPARTPRHAQRDKTGLLVTELMGQGVNIVNGDYPRRSRFLG